MYVYNMQIETKIRQSEAGHSVILFLMRRINGTSGDVAPPKPFAEALLEEIGGSRA